MGFRMTALFVAGLGLLGTMACAAERPVDARDFTPLFADGSALRNWTVSTWSDVGQPAEAGAVWKVEDGVLHGSTPRGTWLVSKQLYGDFILDFEWKLGSQGNSGCGIRFPDAGDPAFDGLEIQMADEGYNAGRDGPDKLTGSLYKALAPSKQVYKPVEWNHYQIHAKGGYVRVFLNGEVVQDVNLDQHTEAVERHDGSAAPSLKNRPRHGRIGFQELSRGGSHVMIRNARIKILDDGSAERPPVPPAGKSWKLAWNDEFDGKKVDETKWEIVGDYKRRDGYWMRKAVSLDGKGRLVMSTLREDGKYIDGCVRTRGKFEHAFGYYVARIRLQKELGHWSAFWLMGNGVGRVGDGGRDGTEIDIMEKPWLDNRVQQTLHWDGYGKDHKTEGHVPTVPGVMEGFHTFGLWWSPTEYVFYVDGQETWRTKAGGVCQVPLFIKLSDEIGKWAGDIAEAKLPDDFLVDYVRVYDLVDQE